MSKFERINHCVSAGGVVYRFDSKNLEVLICGRDSSDLWALPKGTPEAGEDIIDTALREVTEETGIHVINQEFIGSIGYNFSVFNTNLINQKIVFYYLMLPIGGDILNHDDEFDQVVWVNYREAEKILTYKEEALILAKGISMVKEGRTTSY
ncbi:MAG: NUDIX hydrolase [SAR202 cluster bacterium]|nr:NUDIX hydrolase [SAR202 cluster bacterium]|tara:strand:- start:60683 stop:61138 length:456 start_codon:yes stop_codon:yes gene_type:complete